MLAFHLDLKMALLAPEALRDRMRMCARLGYDTLLWEIEDAVAWESCPACAAPGAYTKAAFKALLQEARTFGLANVPLLQTLGHAEYVLRHPPYASFGERVAGASMYCPSNPAVVPFLTRWIAEVLDLFGPVRNFHIGADEAWQLGSCPECKAYAEAYGLSRLFIDHINAVATPLLERGVRPLMWADMLLHHPEALDRLDRRIALVDWLYDRHAACGNAWFFGAGGAHTPATIPQTLLERFGPFLYPQGEEPGRAFDPFYSGAFLAAAGFDVITAPGSASCGDSVFTSRNWLHVINTFDSARSAARAGRPDVIQTSWSIRLNPHEMQAAAIAAAAYALCHPAATVEEFQRAFEEDRFGAPCPEFWPAAACLSTPCLFADSVTLGFNYPAAPIDLKRVGRVIAVRAERGQLEEDARVTRRLLAAYREGATRFAALRLRVRAGADALALYEAAARQLENRADAALLFVEEAGAVAEGRQLAGARREEAQRILARLRELREEQSRFYQTCIRAERIPQYLTMIYAPVEQALAGLAGESGGGASN